MTVSVKKIYFCIFSILRGFECEKWPFTRFLTRLRTRKIWKNQNFKISWIIILDIPLGMPHTKFEPNWMKTLGYIKLFPKFKLKIWYVFYIKGFQPLGLWLAITSRKINIFQNFQKILKDIFIYNNILKF